ncbi:MAG TPA: PH domain-containing protein, partial [Patescibacteria group bacterium]|nr:PH domain-containing protein [Patescibacteria group bacterium]
MRVLLVDKKPLNYLTVEDMRFDMISEMDYSHRLLGATISISSGDKNLRFRSYNQARLRKLIGHVQHCMAESKKRIDTHQEGQVQHLEQINKQ